MNNVLVISDTHAPFNHHHTLDFLRDTYRKYKCNKVVHIGDELDFHALSFHVNEHDSMGAKEEFKEGLKFMKQLYKLFPNVDVCISNHTSIPYRRANEISLPYKIFMKSYAEWMEAPNGWHWAEHHEIDRVLYIHGMGYSGKNGAINAVIDNHMSTVIGHLHSFAGVQWIANSIQKSFGMNVGCLVDKDSYAMRYGKHFRHKPVIGCGVVFGGVDAKFEPMQLGTRIKRLSK